MGISVTGNSFGGKLTSVLEQSFRRYSSDIALLSPDQLPLSYSELEAHIDYIRKVCEASGIAVGQRVGVLLPQGPENAVICLALMAHFSCVPLNPADAVGLVDRVIKLRLNGLVAVPSLLPSDFSSSPVTLLLAEVSPGTRAGECSLRKSQFAVAGGQLKSCESKSNESTLREAMPLVLQTSGSTALPKVVPLSDANLLASMANLVRSLSLSSDDRCLNMMPQYHIGALLDLWLVPLSIGGSVVITRDMQAQTFFDVMNDYRPTLYQAVPTMLADILGFAERYQFTEVEDSLRLCRAVSATLPIELGEKVSELLNTSVVEIYGMTETAGLIASNSPLKGEQVIGSVGQPAGPEVAILDELGNRAAPGYKGEVVIRGDNVFAGYEMEDEGAAVPDSFLGEWFRSGDEGYFDKDGNLFLCGRLKDVINRGGEKVSPLEVDLLLLSHPWVHDAACFAVPHTTLGEDIHAAVMLRDTNVDSETFRNSLKSKIADYKLPRRILFVDHIPRTKGGKLQRHLLPQLLSDTPISAAAVCTIPETEVGKLLARMWQDFLNVETVYSEDDFFELGGDSLKAVSFLTELEHHLSIRLDPGVLFDHSTLSSLEKHLLTTNEEVVQELGSMYLPEPLFEKLQQLMSGWKGVRASSRSLIIGHNTMGSLPPLFWCSSDKDNFFGLSRELGQEQPVYGMRSLFPLPERTPHNNQLLARHLIEEIRSIQPSGPYFLGAYCEGGKIIREISLLLQTEGEDVALLYLAEHHVQEPYQGRVAMMLTTSGEWSPLVLYPQPGRGWAKVLACDPSLKVVNFRHREFNESRGIKEVAAHLSEEMKAVHSGNPAPFSYTLPKVTSAQILTPEICRTSIEGQLNHWQPPKQLLTVTVKVTNKSDQVWKAYDNSGILLMARWRRNHTGRVKDWQAGSAPLFEEVPPGKCAELKVQVQTPPKWGGYTLELDLCDEGLFYFSTHGAEILSLPIMVMPGLGWLNFIANKNKTGEEREI